MGRRSRRKPARRREHPQPAPSAPAAAAAAAETGDATVSRPPVWPAILIAACGVLVYLNSVHGVFLFDDIPKIVENRSLRELSQWHRHVLTDRRPAVWLTLALNYAGGGDEEFGYHVVNIAVHVLAALVLYGVVRRTLLLPRLRPRFQRHAHWLAMVISLLWLVHPLQTQCVTYLIQRSEAMMGLFYLLTLYCVIRGTYSVCERCMHATPARGKYCATCGAPRPWMRPYAWYVGGVVCCALAMGSKAVAVSAPVLMLVFDRVFLSDGWRDTLGRRWGLYLALCGTWLVLVSTGVARGVLQPGPNSQATVGFGYRGATAGEYLLTQPGVVVHYLRLAVWPAGLCLDYWWPMATSVSDAALPGMVIVALLAVTCWLLWRKPALGFLGAWFFIILAPTSSFIPIKDAAFEHRMYLPLIAVVCAVVFAGWYATERLDRRATRSPGTTGGGPSTATLHGAALALAMLTGAALAARTVARNRDYHGVETMWRDVVTKRPENPRAVTDYAKALADRGENEAAERYYRRALELMPDYYKAHNNLGNLLVRTGRVEEGLTHLRETLRLKPNDAEGCNNLGVALYKLGRYDEAAELFARAARRDPYYPAAHSNLGNCASAAGAQARRKYEQTGDKEYQEQATKHYREAVQHYREAVRLQPDFADGHNNLGTALLELGNVQGAIDELLTALRIKPDYADAINNLAVTMARNDLIESLYAEHRHMPVMRRVYTRANMIMGDFLRDRGDYDGAAKVYRAALQADPQLHAARQALESMTRRRP